MKLEGKTALVTGAMSGLGAATARHLAECGMRVIAVDIQPRAEQANQKSLPNVHFITADVASATDMEQAVAFARDRLGGLHAAVNCAGILGTARAVSKQGPLSLDEFSKVIRVNLIGTFNVIRLAAHAMMANPGEEDGERGVIVNTASVAAFEGQIGQAAYSASKGGVAALTLPLAREFAERGVRVVAIAPGVFDTAMMQNAPASVRESLAAQIPFPRRLGKPEEFAFLVQHIFENRMLNGDILRLDGAIRMGAK